MNIQLASQSQAPFYSLRYRMLLPLAAVVLTVALAIGGVSYWLGDRAAQRAMDSRVQAIELTLNAATFPLTRPVLETLSRLSGAEFVAYADDGRLVGTTLREGIDPGDARYRSRSLNFPRRENTDAVRRVLVLFDDSELRESRWQAASLPLITGLSTIVLMAVVAWAFAQRLISRIARLKNRVERIAGGEFLKMDSEPTFATALGTGGLGQEESSQDELGQLNESMIRMGRDLARLWKTVQRQERERLIHLLAAGLAHQLRNSLTGARMAVELHAQKCLANQDGGLHVALRELERTEDYVQRILVIASEQEEAPQEGSLRDAVDEIWQGVMVIAKHQGVELNLTGHVESNACVVKDRRSLSAALQNLILNGLQAGGHRVDVLIEKDQVVDGSSSVHQWRVRVRDDGKGPPDLAVGDIFDAFVTTKPEGMGLGLTLVRQAAARLGGEVCWTRENGVTEFQLKLVSYG